jgi:hypothetical protein
MAQGTVQHLPEASPTAPSDIHEKVVNSLRELLRPFPIHHIPTYLPTYFANSAIFNTLDRSESHLNRKTPQGPTVTA